MGLLEKFCPLCDDAPDQSTENPHARLLPLGCESVAVTAVTISVGLNRTY